MRAVPDYHPEFGLLCPSPRRRRGMRLAALCAVTAMAIGATMGLAVARWPASGDGLAAASEPANHPRWRGSPQAAASRPPGTSRASPRRSTRSRICWRSFSRRTAARAIMSGMVRGRPIGSPMSSSAAPMRRPHRQPRPRPSRSRSRPRMRTKLRMRPPLRSSRPSRPKSQSSRRAIRAVRMRCSTRTRVRDSGSESYDPYRNPYRATGGQSGFDPSFGRSW